MAEPRDGVQQLGRAGEAILGWVDGLDERPARPPGLNGTPPPPPQDLRDAMKAIAEGSGGDLSTIATVLEAVLEYGTALAVVLDMEEQGDPSGGWDAFALLARLAAADLLEDRAPFFHALLTLLGIVVNEPEGYVALDPGTVSGLLQGDGTEVLARAWPAGSTALVGALAQLGGDRVQAWSGWDPEPGGPNGAERLAANALTVLVRLGEGAQETTIGVTGLPVLEPDGSSGFLLAISGEYARELPENPLVDEVRVAAVPGLTAYVHQDPSRSWRDAVGSQSVSLVRRGRDRVGEDHPIVVKLEVLGVELGVQVGAFGWELEIGTDGVEGKLEAVDGKFVLEASKLLPFLPDLDVEFDVGLRLHDGQVSLQGGSGLKARLPAKLSVGGGAFVVQYLELAIRPPKDGKGWNVDLVGGFSTKLFGVFTASIDQLGLGLDLDKPKTAEAPLVLRPPKGMGLRLNAPPVTGGGYLFFDPERHEYAGALDLRIPGLGLQAIGALTTELPEGRDGFAAIVLVYARIPAFPLWSTGLFLTGVGGVIGINHRLDLDVLGDGLKSGVLDDVLFPEDPVGEAPRILARLREVFPLEPGAMTFGVAVEVSLGQTLSPLFARLALVIGLEDGKLASVSLLGQVTLQLPARELELPAIIRLSANVLTTYDAKKGQLLARAALHDSKILVFDLDGEVLLLLQFGDDSAFVLSAGGFHPGFPKTELPAGCPKSLERLGFGVSLGPVELSLKQYFAMTPCTVQFGSDVSLHAEIGPFEASGGYGFDALLRVSPRVSFKVDANARVRVAWDGHTLAGVEVRGRLEGPGRWRATGYAEFKILCFSKSFRFDESFGKAPEQDVPEVEVGLLVLEELRATENWRALPPPSPFVRLAEPDPALPVPAHPLSVLEVRQAIAPLGVELEHHHHSRVKGARKLELGPVTVNGLPLRTEAVTDRFAPASFRKLSDEQKLTAPSFERFAAGTRVGGDAYTLPSDDALVEPVVLDHETITLRRKRPIKLPPGTLRGHDPRRGARHGAAARSAAGFARSLRPLEPVVHVELTSVLIGGDE